MNGTNTQDGKPLSGIDHLKQSIRDILTTPVGSRVMRREYGSNLIRIIDAPMNSETIMRIYEETAVALARWEPRFKLTKTEIAAAKAGSIELNLTGEYLPDGKPITLSGVVVK
jgi:phage baseplate assembly protein W